MRADRDVSDFVGINVGAKGESSRGVDGGVGGGFDVIAVWVGGGEDVGDAGADVAGVLTVLVEACKEIDEICCSRCLIFSTCSCSSFW